MSRHTTLSLAGAALLGAALLPAVPASAASRAPDGLLLRASGGWATRAEGKRSTYGQPYGYDYGYDDGYRYEYGYPGQDAVAGPGYGYGPYGGDGYGYEGDSY